MTTANEKIRELKRRTMVGMLAVQFFSFIFAVKLIPKIQSYLLPTLDGGLLLGGVTYAVAFILAWQVFPIVGAVLLVTILMRSD